MATLVNPYTAMLHNAPMRCVIASADSGKCILNCKLDFRSEKGDGNDLNANNLCRLVACIQQAFDPSPDVPDEAPGESNGRRRTAPCYTKPSLLRLSDKWIYTSRNVQNFLVSLVCKTEYQDSQAELLLSVFENVLGVAVEQNGKFVEGVEGDGENYTAKDTMSVSLTDAATVSSLVAFEKSFVHPLLQRHDSLQSVMLQPVLAMPSCTFVYLFRCPETSALEENDAMFPWDHVVSCLKDNTKPLPPTVHSQLTVLLQERCRPSCTSVVSEKVDVRPSVGVDIDEEGRPKCGFVAAEMLSPSPFGLALVYECGAGDTVSRLPTPVTTALSACHERVKCLFPSEASASYESIVFNYDEMFHQDENSKLVVKEVVSPVTSPPKSLAAGPKSQSSSNLEANKTSSDKNSGAAMRPRPPPPREKKREELASSIRATRTILREADTVENKKIVENHQLSIDQGDKKKSILKVDLSTAGPAAGSGIRAVAQIRTSTPTTVGNDAENTKGDQVEKREPMRVEEVESP